jgi:hypothetical protein
MSHNNKLSPQAEQAWRDSLPEPCVADDPDEPSTPAVVPDLGASDVEFLDALCDQGRRR